jgi:hypothetical protein
MFTRIASLAALQWGYAARDKAGFKRIKGGREVNLNYRAV